MPVSTRSKISTENDRNPTMQEQQRLRNPYHGLKEKLKTLTLLYEQQKQASKSLRNTNTFMRERNSITNPNSTITKTFVLPQPPSSSNNDDDAKENQNLIVGQDQIVGFSYLRKVSATTNAAAPVAAVVRRLSMPASVKGKDEELGKCVSRIMVFVRVRPMNRKEIELGSRCCVRIVNQRDVYLTESANEKDYLRLNRVKGRHFVFDGSFNDSATQLQVYSTMSLKYEIRRSSTICNPVGVNMCLYRGHWSNMSLRTGRPTAVRSYRRRKTVLDLDLTEYRLVRTVSRREEGIRFIWSLK